MTPASASLHMARALQLAALGRYSTRPNPRVGCVIAHGDQVVGEGWHQRAGEPHAEVHALRMAGAKAKGADVFVTLEPCAHQGRTPPCVAGLIAAGVGRVWAAMEDPNPLVRGKGIAELRAAGIEVHVGLCEPEARALNKGFISRMTRERPYVTLKLAASLDGRTAMASGESQWITSEAARIDVHRLRAEAGAVLTSSSTVLADDPELTVRHVPALPKCSPSAIVLQPDRIVLDTNSRVPPSAKVWVPGVTRFWITSPESLFAVSLATVNVKNNVQVLAVDTNPQGHLDLQRALTVLALRGVNHVLVEAGPKLAGAFLQAGLVDEVITYLAPNLLGHEGRALTLLSGLERLDQRLKLRFTETRMVGADLRITAVPEPQSH